MGILEVVDNGGIAEVVNTGIIAEVALEIFQRMF